MTTLLASDVLTETNFDVLEQTTPRYTATLTDDAGNPIGAASLLSLLLSVYVILSDGTIFYIRNDQNALNANNVTLDNAGALVWAVQVADTTLAEAVPFEKHWVLWQWTWTSGGTTRSGKKLLTLSVKNLTVAS